MPERSIIDCLRLRSSLNDVSTKNFWQSLVAECFGTFILVFIGLGSCYSRSAGLVGAALAFGFGGALGIWLSAPISGGNINPAVSLGLLVARQISLIRCLLYWLFQVVGALLAAKFIQLIMKNHYSPKGISENTVGAGGAFFCEVIITFVLVFTVMRMCVEKARSETERGVGAFAIGLSILVGVLCGAGFSGGSMNPARSIGPAVVFQSFKNIWIYIFGPLVGGLLAGLFQQLVFTSELSKAHLVAYLTDPYFGTTPPKLTTKEDTEAGDNNNKDTSKKHEDMEMKETKEENEEKVNLTSEKATEE